MNIDLINYHVLNFLTGGSTLYFQHNEVLKPFQLIGQSTIFTAETIAINTTN